MNPMILRLVVLSITLFAGAGYLARADQFEPVPARQSFAALPMQLGQWKGTRAENIEGRVLEVLGVDEYLNRIYEREPAQGVGLYIGYYQSQRQGDAIHSPLNCLPGAGWQPVSKSEIRFPVAKTTGGSMEDISVNRYVIQKGTAKQVVLYWYQSHGRVVASEYRSKAYMVWDAIRTNRTDAALVRVIAPAPDLSAGAEAAAERTAVEFVQGLFPLLGGYLPS